MIKTLDYQQRAVKELIEKAVRLLEEPDNRQKIIFKAPTGSGKTVMCSEMMDKLKTELDDSHWHGAAMIWIAPNQLHQQSYMKMKNYFTETRNLRPVMYDELDHSTDGYIHSGEVLFTNWESINKDKNLMTRESEQLSSLYDICRRTKEQGLPLIVIVDEAHAFYGGTSKAQKATATKSQKVLERISPKLEILVSATIDSVLGCELVNVSRQEVIREQMIKEGIVINPEVNFNVEANSLTEHLLDCAIKRREQLAEAYRKLNVNINPLLLIQLPNDNSDKMDSDDQTIAEEVKQVLEVKYGINTANGKLAVWLSGEKENVENIERSDNMTQALLFKQAIALGWDCPRAAVLLIFRKMESFQFTMQTVGRILRMPEQKHYSDPKLNRGYVYTDLSKDKIQIVADDIAYITPLYAKRREGLVNVALTSEYSVYKSEDRARLLPYFKPILWRALDNVLIGRNVDSENLEKSLPFDDKDESENNNGTVNDVFSNKREAEKRRIKFDVHHVEIEIPEDVYIDQIDIPREITIDQKHRRRYAQSYTELTRLLNVKCGALLTGYEKQSTHTLVIYLMDYLENRFELFETVALKVLLYHDNWPKFELAIKNALEAYQIQRQKKQGVKRKRSFEEYIWEVPEERLYNGQSNKEVGDVKNHALLPFIRYNGATHPEKNFEEFLEDNKTYIDWWYKNGDSGKQHYAISYINNVGEKALFYPDFVIRMRNGQIFLFDTKTRSSDAEAPAKHNALIEYMNNEANAHLNLKGGILLPDGNLWRYSPLLISNTEDLHNWTAFFPQDYKE